MMNTHSTTWTEIRFIKNPHMFQFKSNHNYLYLDDKLNQEHREQSIFVFKPEFFLKI